MSRGGRCRRSSPAGSSSSWASFRSPGVAAGDWACAAAAFVFALLLSRFFGSAEASGSEGGATGE